MFTFQQYCPCGIFLAEPVVKAYVRYETSLRKISVNLFLLYYNKFWFLYLVGLKINSNFCSFISPNHSETLNFFTYFRFPVQLIYYGFHHLNSHIVSIAFLMTKNKGSNFRI